MWNWVKRTSRERGPWVTTVGCEGGPLLVADAEDFVTWTGGQRRSGQTQLHVWGRFTAELPERFHPGGDAGHFYVECGSHEAARAALQDMVAFVQERWPGTRAEAQADGVVCLTRPDGVRQFVDLSPSSEYEAAGLAAGDRDLWTWRVASGGSVVLWEVGGACVVDVGLDDLTGEVVLLHAWADDVAAEAAAREQAWAGADEEATAERLVSKGGTLVAVWSPVAFGDLVGVKDVPSLGRRARKAGPVQLSNGGIDGLGTALAVRPGAYRIRTAAVDTETWGARWCRLVPDKL